MFAVSVTEKEGRWIVEAQEGDEVTFVGWYRSLIEAQTRREIEVERLRKKHPSEALDLRC